MFDEALNEQAEVPDKRLGKLPPKSSPKALHFAQFLKLTKAEPPPPDAIKFWGKRKPFPAYTWGNNDEGCCTIASQALMTMRLERLEQRRTVVISTEEVHRVYRAMTDRLYGGGDTGAYETDALDNWRNPDLTFRDGKGRPQTIDAYLRVNHTDPLELKRAMAFSGAHGIKVCYALPLAWATIPIDQPWNLPEGQAMIGDWLPYSWGGHSMAAIADYNTSCLNQPHTWYTGGKEVQYGIQQVTWRGALAYLDEAHIVIDSVNSWKKRQLLSKNQAGVLAEMVNTVSDVKIAA